MKITVKALEQLLIADCGGRVVPEKKIRRIGRSVRSQERQGDLMKPDKIAYGNLPDDQLTFGGGGEE